MRVKWVKKIAGEETTVIVDLSDPADLVIFKELNIAVSAGELKHVLGILDGEGDDLPPGYRRPPE